MGWPEHSSHTERINGDRRYDRRYGIVLDLRWKLVRRRKVLESGTGTTLDLSSGGLLFDAGRPLPVGLNVELSISWPALLHNIAPMQLVITGRIVRANGAHTGIQMTQHEFRTMAKPAEHCGVLAESRRRPPLLASAVHGFGKFERLQ